MSKKKYCPHCGDKISHLDHDDYHRCESGSRRGERFVVSALIGAVTGSALLGGLLGGDLLGGVLGDCLDGDLFD